MFRVSLYIQNSHIYIAKLERVKLPVFFSLCLFPSKVEAEGKSLTSFLLACNWHVVGSKLRKNRDDMRLSPFPRRIIVSRRQPCYNYRAFIIHRETNVANYVLEKRRIPSSIWSKNDFFILMSLDLP